MINTIFLDRDGVINRKLDNNYVKNWSEFVFLDGAIEALVTLRSLCRFLIIITNQRGISRGIMTDKDLNDIHYNMTQELSSHNVKIDAIYYCPDDLGSPDRKPAPGMGYKAKADFTELDFSSSLMIGDSMSDLEFASNLGLRSVWIGSADNKKAKALSDAQFDSLLTLSKEIEVLSAQWKINC